MFLKRTVTANFPCTLLETIQEHIVESIHKLSFYVYIYNILFTFMIHLSLEVFIPIKCPPHGILSVQIGVLFRILQ